MILHHLAVVSALSDQWFPSYERFCEEVIFRKCEFAFSWIFLGYFVFELLPETAEYDALNVIEEFGTHKGQKINFFYMHI